MGPGKHQYQVIQEFIAIDFEIQKQLHKYRTSIITKPAQTRTDKAFPSLLSIIPKPPLETNPPSQRKIPNNPPLPTLPNRHLRNPRLRKNNPQSHPLHPPKHPPPTPLPRHRQQREHPRNLHPPRRLPSPPLTPLRPPKPHPRSQTKRRPIHLQQRKISRPSNRIKETPPPRNKDGVRTKFRS